MSNSLEKLNSVDNIVEALATAGYICNEQIATVVYLAAARGNPSWWKVHRGWVKPSSPKVALSDRRATRALAVPTRALMNLRRSMSGRR